MELVVQKREKLGKVSKSSGKEGFIPAEIYGHGFKNEHLSVKTSDFLKVYKEAGENTIVNLTLGNEKWPALIYDVQEDRLSGAISHIDFYRVTMTEKIRSHVPLEFIGESIVVKEKLGILNKSMSDVEVEALPADLPHRITVDISVLDTLDKSIYAKDLKVASGVKVLVDPQTVIATVIPPQKEEEVVAPAIDVSAVKVESEEKKAERDQQKEEAKKEAAK